MEITLRITLPKICIFLLTIILVIYWLFYVFKKRNATVSKETINSYVNAKKYVQKLFIEIGNNKEVLRYFIYNTKWKHRIVTIFNQMYVSQRYLFERYLPDFKPFLPWYARFFSIEKLKNIIQNNENILDNIKNLKLNEHVEFEIHHSSQIINNKRRKILKSWLSLMEIKNLMILSTAGNGKSSILCNISELVMKLGHPCLFLNAKNINIEVDAYVKKCLKIPKVIDGFVYLLINLYLCLIRKKWFIIIDAINENNIDSFKASLSDFIDSVKSYSKINIIISCRSEYYEQRFSNNFNNFYTYTLEMPRKNEYPKLLSAYSNAYNFKGSISVGITAKLTRQLLLLRIFFEIYKDTDRHCHHINKHELYTKYLDVTINNNQTVNDLMQKIVNCMVDQYTFESLPLNTIYEYREQIEKISDGSVLICITIKQNINTLIETNTEAVIFPFDELRDYCIARYMIMAGDNNKLFSLLDRMYKDAISPLEGVLAHTYSFFKECDSNKCIEILDKYTFKVRMPYEPNGLHYLNLYLIMGAGDELQNFEYHYLLHRFLKYSDELINTLEYLLENELELIRPNISLITEILLKSENFSNIENLIKNICSIGNPKTRESLLVIKAKEYLHRYNNLSDSLVGIFAIIPLNIGIEYVDAINAKTQTMADQCVSEEFREYLNNR